MPDKETVLVAVKKTDYQNPQIDKLLIHLGGMGRHIRMGENVLLKINLLSARTPDEAVTTHPEFVRAIAREVKKAGGLPYIGDSPAGRFSERILTKAYEKSGIMAMAKEENIPLNYDTGSEKLIIPNGIKIKKIPICNFILRADKIIGIPKLKTHSLQYLTLACKNMYGAVPGLVKAKYHAIFPGRMAFAEMLLDIYSYLNPDLFIMDAVLGLHGEGPAGNGDPIEIGLALASKDGIAMDIAVCNLIGIEPASIPLLKRAKIRGMWPHSIEYPILVPHENRVKGFNMPGTASHLVTGERGQPKSPVITEKCIGCGECRKICPKKAVNIVDETANIDYSKCIRCYCCQEVCPANAIRLMNIKYKGDEG
ncbi:MAG: DUF362 domain-containing protein [Deltaproteobacteria bacterium]|nr:DUF362 domain-containing protein [Deltaproteobacteria bacterium]